MKIVLNILILIVGLTSTTYAVPILLEKNYTNYAFGYQNKGCFIDDNGYVYYYDISTKSPMTMSPTRLQNSEIEEIKALLQGAATGAFVEKRAVYDAGSHLWSGGFMGTVIKLKSHGNYQGANSAPQSERLIEKIESYCR